MTVVVGLGCRRGCPAEEIVALVREALARVGREAALLAIPAVKADEAGVAEAARRLGLAVCPVDLAALRAAQPRCATRSARAEAALGVASVAEGAALAAGGPTSRLLLPRLASRRATCAIALGAVAA